jgi:hypothetical protein
MNPFEDEPVPDSPFYRQTTMTVSVEDLKLGLHVGDAAATRKFPMREPSQRLEVDMEDGTAVRFRDDNPAVRALLGIADAFRGDGKGQAVFSRITAFHEILDAPSMRKWVKRNKKASLEYADAVLDVAAYFPFTPGTLSFDASKFSKEVQKIADEKYGGQFT